MAARALILAAVLVAGPALLASRSAAAPAIEWQEQAGQPGELRICGLPAGAAPEVRAVESGGAFAADLPPLWGEFSREGDCALFRPRHRPAPGMELLVSLGNEILGRVALAPPEAKARVAEIYPSGDTIPANLLRLYVTFSGPMSLKGIERHVHLRDAAGEEIPTAFVDVPDGLWDPGRRRLTLFLHPGRVKSGIAVGEQLGKVLVAGDEVSLEVDAGARDADGAPLQAGGRRTWKVGPPQAAPLSAAQFRLEVKGGALEVAAAVALDRALALGAFTVLQDGAEIAGEWTIDPGERRLSFRPSAPWRRGEPCVLRLGERLEDVAGNRLGRAFEVEDGQDAAVLPVEIEFRP